MKKLTAIVLVIAATALALSGIKQAQGPKPNEPCRACVAVGRHTEFPCLPFTCEQLNARNVALIETDIHRNHEPIHVGGRTL